VGLSPDGIITTLAGTGIQGYAGDGGPADNAQLDFPTGVGVDRAGNLFIAHRKTLNRNAGFFSGVIRRVSPSGEITTIAGAAG
jgi:hypothetical protein